MLGRDNDLQFMLRQMMFVDLVNNRSKGWKPIKLFFLTVSVTFLQKGKIILKIQFKKKHRILQKYTPPLYTVCTVRCCHPPQVAQNLFEAFQ